MQMSGNTILITGGGSGIGRALAEAFHALGNQVVIAGRRQQVLEETVAANPGMKSTVFDIENPDAIRSFAAQVAKDYPSPECRHSQRRHHASRRGEDWRGR